MPILKSPTVKFSKMFKPNATLSVAAEPNVVVAVVVKIFEKDLFPPYCTFLDPKF